MDDIKQETDTYVTKTKYNRETGLPISQRTFLKDKLETPPDNSPAEVLFDETGNPRHLNWYREGKLHRDDGPAMVELVQGTDQPRFEAFFVDGKPINPSIGPYRIIRDKETGDIIKQVNFGDPEFPEDEPQSPIAPGY